MTTFDIGTKVQHIDWLISGEVIEVISSNGCNTDPWSGSPQANWEVVDILWERPFFGKLITTESIDDLVFEMKVLVREF